MRIEGEAILLRRFAQGGDAEAFAEITRLYAGMVYGTCLRITGDQDHAADAAQETFFQLVKNAGRVTGSVGRWLHQVARRRAIDMVRRDAARRRRELAFAAMTPLETDKWADVSPVVDEALNELEEDLRDILLRHYLQGQTMAEIAAATDCSPPTISRRVDRALEALRGKLRTKGILVTAASLSLLMPNATTSVPAVVAQELGKMALAVTGANAGGTGGAILGGLKLVVAATIAVFGVGGYMAYHNHRLIPPPPPTMAAAQSSAQTMNPSAEVGPATATPASPDPIPVVTTPSRPGPDWVGGQYPPWDWTTIKTAADTAGSAWSLEPQSSGGLVTVIAGGKAGPRLATGEEAVMQFISAFGRGGLDQVQGGIMAGTGEAVGKLTSLSGGVELRPGTVVEFAGLEEGRRILGERDSFIQTLSPFDRSLRMQTSRRVSEAEFVAYLTNQVRTWSESEKSKVMGVLNQIGAQTRDLNLVFPRQFYLVKTTGNEEGNAAYLRGRSIILPQMMVSGNTTQLAKVLAHELFHVYTYHNPLLRAALYSVIGFRLGNPIPMPAWLVDRRITDPNPGPRDFTIRVKVGTERTPCIPVFYSKSTNYTGGQLPDYLVSKLLVLEGTNDGYRPVLLPGGQPRLLDPYAVNDGVADYFEQIGANTSYNIHPEETLADNFVFLAEKTVPMNSPRVPYLLREVINHRSAALMRLPAGRFWSALDVDADATCVVETSANLVDWTVWDYVTNAPAHLEMIDPEAWLFQRRFFRARTMNLPVFIPADTNQMVWISPGTFRMGSPNAEVWRYTNEGPQTLVTLSRGFWLGEYEVTQGEYAAVMGRNPSFFPGFPNCPVEQVAWPYAVEYCARVTERARAARRLPSGWAYRLPTEAEWEFAARAGTTNRYSFGEDTEGVEVYRHATFKDNSTRHRGPRPVGVKPPNPWGLYGIYGNVGEWCADWYGPYRGGSVTDPQGPASGSERVWRGGGFLLRARDCRCANRGKAKPEDRQAYIGFRIALAPAGP